MTPSSKTHIRPLYEHSEKAIPQPHHCRRMGAGKLPIQSEIALAKEYGVTRNVVQGALNVRAYPRKRLVHSQAREPLWLGITPVREFPVSSSQRQNGKRATVKLAACGSPRRRTPNGGSSLLRTPKSSTSTVYVCLNDFGHQRTGRAYRPPVFSFQLRVR